MKWRSIESAPGGATDVLLAFNGGVIRVGWRHSAGYFMETGSARPFRFDPTHWMPLPAPPVQKIPAEEWMKTPSVGV